jgi:tRNA A37 threonylcarbamoyladenosine modification protein TsaB
MESLEQELMTMLRNLPIPITINWRGGQYYWQTEQGSGSSSHLVTVIEQAFRYLMSARLSDADAVGGKQ